jgi:hypothetical protein
LCHFGETCRESGIAGRFEVLDAPVEKDAKYTVSWTGETQVTNP